MTEPTEVAKQVSPIWKCEVKDCDIAFPPTLKGYRQMSGHQLKHANEGVPKDKRGYHLADENTGEVLARSIKEATPFFVEEPPKEAKKVAPTIPATSPLEVKAPLEAKPTPQVTPEIPEESAKVEPLSAIPEAKVEAKPTAKGEKEGEITAPQASSDGIFRYTITLPADAFTLFNLAKAFGLEKDSEKPFDEWLWDCVRMRYEADYKMRLVLTPLKEK